jgi:lysophospholipase L1-like esterase
MAIPPLRLLLSPILLATAVLAGPARWAAGIDAFTRADAIQPPPRDAVLFIGSSSIRMWTTLPTDFPHVSTIDRGFGGSELADSLFYADRIVIPYRPRAVVLYAGDNDIAAGKTPATVAADFAAFREKVHAALPAAHLFYLSIKLSPSRARFREAMLRANALIAADCARHPDCTFVDVTTPMLDAAGRPRRELFGSDLLHMQPAGYALWTRILRPLLDPRPE